MKAFYSPVAEDASSPVAGMVVRSVEASPSPDPTAPIHVRVRARVAVYETPAAAPRVVDVEPAPVAEFIESLSTTVHELARNEGGTVPYTVIREVTENFIHADFSEPVVSVLDGGQTIRFADQGPGMRDKDRVLLPGFTTAHGEMKRYIRGVGSGLPLVREYLVHSGGSLAIEDNLGAGSVVTIYSGLRGSQRPVLAQRSAMGEHDVAVPSAAAAMDQASLYPAEPAPPEPRLSARQKHVLALVLESGLAGPSLISKELGVGVSTAYRDLASLEEAGLISADGGKRTLTDEGLAYLGRLSNNS